MRNGICSACGEPAGAVVHVTAAPGAALALATELGAEDAAKLTDAFAALLAALAEETRRAYAGDWAQFCRFLAASGKEPMRARTTDVVAWCESRKALNTSTRVRGLAAVRSIYQAIVQAGVRSDNPAREVKLRSVAGAKDSTTPFLAIEEAARLLAGYDRSTWLGWRDGLMADVGLLTGLRRESIAGLRAKDLTDGDPPKLFVQKAKRGKEGQVGIPKALFARMHAWVVDQHLTGNQPIFPARELRPNVPVTPGTVWAAIKRGAEAAGIDPARCTPHALRRTFATELDARHVDLRVIQGAMLHSDQKTTENYIKSARTARSAPGETFAADVLPKEEES